MVGPSLTEEQRAAVEVPGGPHVIVAPPGSGKTEVLTRRALWLVEQSQGEPFRILALTYTVKAADELAERVRHALGEEAWRVEATTLHALCLDMLQHYGEAVGVSRQVSVLDSDRFQLDLLADALASAGYNVDEHRLRDLLSRIDQQRFDLTPPELTVEEPGVDERPTLLEAYRIYEEALDDARVLDFPGMLYRAWRLLQEDPWVADHYRRQFRHVLIDEAQDLTRPQLEVLRELCGDELRNIFIVADGDQEIYGFAGASSKHYVEFADQIGARSLSLTTNFRSALRIIEAAERLRAHIRTLPVARRGMSGATTAQGWIGVHAYSHPEAEAGGVAGWVAGLLRGGLAAEWLAKGEDPTVKPEDLCVMARTGFALEAVERALQHEGLETVLRTEEGGLFDSATGQAVYLVLRILANPRDRASLKRVEEALSRSRRVARVAEESGDYRVAGDDRTRLEVWLGNVELPDDISSVALIEVPTGLPWPLIEQVRAVEAQTGDDSLRAERELWESDLAQFQWHWERYAALTRVPDRTLGGFVRHLSRLQRTPPDWPGVRLLTPYRAKGLQFRAVAIMGMVEGSFPHYRSRTGREIDEERRAVYVAVTRASRAALLTYPQSRTNRGGRVFRDPPSRFLGEMGLVAASSNEATRDNRG